MATEITLTTPNTQNSVGFWDPGWWKVRVNGSFNSGSKGGDALERGGLQSSVAFEAGLGQWNF